MEQITLKNLSFTYPNRAEPALSEINLTVEAGSFVVLCGASGCGKTTLLRFLKPALSPHGTTQGEIFFDGAPLAELDAKRQVSEIGFVMQNPDNQIVTDKVWHELAFGLESLGYTTPEIRTRVAEMTSFFGIAHWFYQDVSSLSGGQKQLLNLASVMVMQPRVLLLDEPTGQLDPIAAQEFLRTLQKINRELGTTIILSEHRLEEVFPMADRVICLDEGRVIADGTPEQVGRNLQEQSHEMSLALPTPMRVWNAVEPAGACPITIREGRAWLNALAKKRGLDPSAIPQDQVQEGQTIALELDDLWFRYEKNAPDVIKGMQGRVCKGEVFAVVGGNGTGKTTALSLISGLNRPYRGEVRVFGTPVSKVPNPFNGVFGVLPQNPQTVFAKQTVLLDLLDGAEEDRVAEIAKLCRIEHLLTCHPYDLSGGEQQRAALAKVLLQTPEILLLDEPTKGLDASFKQVFADIIKDLQSQGVTVVMVSHDVEFCAAYADRCALVFDGGFVSVDTPRAFFSGKNFYTTAANRMAREELPRAVLCEDIIRACGGVIAKHENTYLPRRKNPPVLQNTTEPPAAKKFQPRTLLSLFLMLLVVPLTLFVGNAFFDDRKYYFISFVILCATLCAFALAFEMKKPRARELVLVSVLCALAVAGRAAFFMLPQFKPTLALVIIAGVCFGGETGFLVGAVSAFVSNFFFGQGPWTPWQMFALGIIGFLAGVIFCKHFSRQKRAFLCVFGFLAAVLIYGVIMNLSSVVLSQGRLNAAMIKTVLLTGLPFDLIHATATAVFLWFLSTPMMEKLRRVKQKYGLLL